MPFNKPNMARNIAIGVAAISVVAVLAVLGINSNFFSFLSNRAAAPAADSASANPDPFMAQVENREAWHDHRAVASWVASCLGVHSPENLPATFRWSLEPPGRIFGNWPEEKPTGDFTSQHRAVIGLSNALFMERVDSVERLGTVSQSLEKFQVSAIVIGLLTTVFISLSSTDIIKDTNAALTTIKISVKVLAIVLPMVGTAVAALNTFYDPKSDQIRYGRMSEAAGQLHRQIALGIANLTCVPASTKNNPAWDKNATQIDAWINAHKSLISPATQKAEAATSSDSATNQGRAGGSPKQPTK